MELAVASPARDQSATLGPADDRRSAASISGRGLAPSTSSRQENVFGSLPLRFKLARNTLAERRIGHLGVLIGRSRDSAQDRLNPLGHGAELARKLACNIEPALDPLELRSRRACRIWSWVPGASSWSRGYGRARFRLTDRAGRHVPRKEVVDLHVRVPVVAVSYPYLAENAGYSPMNLGHNILDSITPPEERAVVNRH
jgi:hypothetical protein